MNVLKSYLKKVIRIEVDLKKYIFALLFCLSFSLVVASDMSLEKQDEIIQNYMFLTGQLSQSQATAFAEESEMTDLSGKCGMSIVRDFKLNYDKFDKQLLRSTGVQLVARPDYLPDTISSPSGNFLIHFSTVGDDAVYSNITGGALGYIDSVALILDEVYAHIIDSLGYPEPVRDSFYVAGGDEKYDVYLLDISGPFYGLAWTDSVLVMPNGDSLATAFLEIENDFNNLPRYKNRPLDAFRVTAAHEFFHMVQFAIDATESEQVSNVVAGPAWMEMSSVWMEEEIYDDVNDYYSYLPFFFNDPAASIQQFLNSSDLHPYGSVVFPLFLSEKFDADIIKAIWLKCGEYGPGPHSIQVTGEVIDSVTSSAESFETIFAEFALWNYFTGSRALLAPQGYGYSERESYDVEFSEDPAALSIRTEYDYPVIVPATNNGDYNPVHNSAFYLKLNNVFHLIAEYNCTDSAVAFDTTYWRCNTGTFPTCTDSTEVTSLDAFDTLYIDTFVCIDSIDVMKMILALEGTFSNPWGFSIIYEDKLIKDSIIIDERIFPAGSALGLDVLGPSKYNSITFVITPASSNRHFYTGSDYGVGFGVLNTLNPNPLDSIYFSHSIEPAIFYPYPNPAVYDKLAEKQITFKFQPSTDSTYLIRSIDSLTADTALTNIILNSGYFVIDIFNINGERIRSFEKITSIDLLSSQGQDLVSWDMKNERGNDVASGVYLAYLRLMSQQDSKKTVIKELKTKIAVIR